MTKEVMRAVGVYPTKERALSAYEVLDRLATTMEQLGVIDRNATYEDFERAVTKLLRVRLTEPPPKQISQHVV